MKKRFFYAVATLVGMTVGAGIFSLPYTALKAGFVPVIFYLFFLTGALFIIYLLYAKIILATRKKYRLVGYSQLYLGKAGKTIATLSALLGFSGTLLVYVILGGQFLSLFLSSVLGGSIFLWTVIFFIANSVAIFFGLKMVGSAEFIMNGFLFLLLIVFLVFGWAAINWNNFIEHTVVWRQIFFPYGLALFALLGVTAIPELCQLLEKQKFLIKKAIFWGTFLPLLIYILFILIVLGVSGVNTSKDAILGLVPFFGQPIILVGAIFGLLTISTSFLVLGTNFKKVFQYDYKLGHFLSWLLVCFIPLVLLMFGLKNYILVIGFVGAVMGGIDGLLIILIYKKVRSLRKEISEYSLKVPNLVLGFLGLIFVLGIIYQLFQIL